VPTELGTKGFVSILSKVGTPLRSQYASFHSDLPGHKSDYDTGPPDISRQSERSVRIWPLAVKRTIGTSQIRLPSWEYFGSAS